MHAKAYIILFYKALDNFGKAEYIVCVTRGKASFYAILFLFYSVIKKINEAFYAFYEVKINYILKAKKLLLDDIYYIKRQQGK